MLKKKKKRFIGTISKNCTVQWKQGIVCAVWAFGSLYINVKDFSVKYLLLYFSGINQNCKRKAWNQSGALYIFVFPSMYMYLFLFYQCQQRFKKKNKKQKHFRHRNPAFSILLHFLSTYIILFIACYSTFLSI